MKIRLLKLTLEETPIDIYYYIKVAVDEIPFSVKYNFNEDFLSFSGASVLKLKDYTPLKKAIKSFCKSFQFEVNDKGDIVS